MRTAGVVSDHPADTAAVMGGRVGCKSELMKLGAIAQGIEDHAGLNASKPALGIEFQNLVHVGGEVQDDGDIATLSGKAGSRAARQHGRAKLSARRHGRDYVFSVARHHQADGNLAIVRAIGGVERAAATIEAHLPAQSSLEFLLQVSRLQENVDGLGVGTRRRCG